MLKIVMSWLVYLCFSLIALLLAMPILAASTEASDSSVQLRSLDAKEQVFSDEYHRTINLSAMLTTLVFTDFNQLTEAVNQLNHDGKPGLAVHLIINNITLIKDNLDEFTVIEFVGLLLESNQLSTAKRLIDLINQGHDMELKANARYQYANYLFSRQLWQQTLTLLAGSNKELAPEHQNHALLLKGIALQKLDKYRQAIGLFEAIPTDADDYTSAQINLAISNIRQGWWTDGHLLLQRLIKTAQDSKHERALNRLYITLGYSFLRQQYYRNARDSFGLVGVDSRYMNQSLIGLSLAAANQQDYVGALNGVRILKAKRPIDLTVDEAYLLMPYYYEKSSQHTTASAGYEEALLYFQGRLSELEISLATLTAQVANGSVLSSMKLSQAGHFSLGTEQFKFEPEFATATIEIESRLAQYRKTLSHAPNTKLSVELDRLKDFFHALLTTTIGQLIENRIKYINSYIDQARSGLVRLYDHRGK